MLLVVDLGSSLAGMQPLYSLTLSGRHQRPHTDLAPIVFAPYIWSAAPAEGLAPASGRNLLLDQAMSSRRGYGVRWINLGEGIE